MQKVTIVKGDITRLKVDAVVNAANSRLQAGGGVCGAIFRAAGYGELQDACDKIGVCPTGSAVITEAFHLDAKYIIHAVGPIYQGGKHGEKVALYGAYKKALQLALENHCASIAFPLISAGIYGYPKEEAWEVAKKACEDFLQENVMAELAITFAVLDDDILNMGMRIFRNESL
ncbi:MAG: macro domain-containing protein [Lachnospiraceae bacterium]|nr:macro domain-containing protein [Lachnospiraceae bacterium]